MSESQNSLFGTMFKPKKTILVDGEIAQLNITQDKEIRKELIAPLFCAKLIQAVEFSQINFLKKGT